MSNKPPAAKSLATPSERAALGSELDPVELRNTLLACFQAPDYRAPVLPAIALELTELARRPSVAYSELVRVLERDPLLVASVLKLAQSPLYGGRTRVKTISDGLQRLGINTLKDLAWQVVIGLRLFRVSSYSGLVERLQSHSTFTAYAARIIAGHAGIPAEYAFLCGLLHDIGWSGTLIAVAERIPHPVKSTALFTAIDNMHAEAARTMATLWGLAPEVVEVIAHHHDVTTVSYQAPPLVPVLCVAEQLAEDFDFGLESKTAEAAQMLGMDENLVGRYEQAVAVLGLEPKLAQIRDQLGEVAERLRGLDAG